MSEEWRGVVGISTHEVSNMGRIRRVVTAPGWLAGTILTPLKEAKGYLRIVVHDQTGKRRVVRLHIAVLAAFVGPRPPKHDASHLNGDKADNRLPNLCWETSSENHQRKFAHGTLIHGEAHKCAKLKLGQVLAIRDRVARGEKRCHLASQYGVSGTLVGRIVAGKAWPHAV